MEPLSVHQILFLHSRLIAHTGGSHGVRDMGLLESAAARPWASKAAALFDGLIRNHPFVDGNKRIALAATGLFLERNGLRFVATNEDAEGFTLMAADEHLSLEEIEAWLDQNTVEGSLE